MKKTFTAVAATIIIAFAALAAACDKPPPTLYVDGFYVVSITLAFDEQQKQSILDGFLDAETAAQILLATRNNGEKLPVFGSGGVYEEISAALLPLSGQDALNKFYEFIHLYNDDPGMDEIGKGYFIPLGSSHYVREFEEHARRLFDNHNPSASVGNAFISGGAATPELGYSVSEYGVHIIMIKSLSVR
ncbi:MAG: hypothetical protein FWH03_00420 [Firmicutes bacterium]|nr:hypothetical protein [Bacillota bacterium]